MGHKSSSPIYALGSPLGRSALAVIRVSGEKIPDAIFAKLSVLKEERGLFVRRLAFEGFGDACLVLNFPAPLSYTGEHMLEIHPHGNPAVLSEVFSWLEEEGLREAEAGEFSKRAYLNSKLSLSEAEGVALGIEAESREQLAALEDFRGGVLGEKINLLLDGLEGLLVRVESQLDFSDEEGVVEVESAEIKNGLLSALSDLELLIKNYMPFEKDSLKKKIVLIGKPNVGKSSLFNALVEENVAIVSAMAGTTRDIVRKRVAMAGFDVEIEDTAGLRDQTEDEIEKEGMRLAKEAAEKADLIIHITDNKEEASLLKPSENTLIVLNKRDLHKNLSSDAYLSLSAVTRDGLSDLLGKIQESSLKVSSKKLVSERTYKKLVAAKGLLTTDPLGRDFFEFTAQILRDSLQELRDIYGDFDNEKILDQIFDKFCIGK